MTGTTAMPYVHALVATTVDTLLQSFHARAEAAMSASAQTSRAAQASAAIPQSGLASTSSEVLEPATAVHLTQTARLAAELARASVDVRIVAPTPLATESADAKVIATALRTSIETSGLFYESHIADWAAGERTQAALAREPQASFAREPQTALVQEPHTAPVEQTNDRQMHPESAAGERPLRDTTAAWTNTQQLGEDPRAERASIATVARDLLGQQLQLAADPRLAWHGEAWPGQDATIGIEREPRDEHGCASEPAWRTTIMLELPQLGRMQVELRLLGMQLGVTILAHDASACAWLQAGSNELVAALAAGGLAASAVTVKRDAHTA